MKAAGTQCSTCHQKLTQGKPYVHPPVEDCSSCHDVQISPAGTRITLTGDAKGLCLSCHDSLAAAAEGKLKASHAPVADSCTTCHDPHASAVARLLVAAPPELCSTCHELPGLQAAHGGQLTGGTHCVACHSPHGSANPGMLVGAHRHAPFADKSCDACHRPPVAGRVRLMARGEAVCSACHGEFVTAPPGGSLHAAVQASREAPGCTSCHAPHLSANAKLLLGTGVALCGKCHAAVVKAASDKTGHSPAAEDCTSCHDPHRSPRERLLKEGRKTLCQTCHDPADASFRKAHLGAALAGADCTGCHSPHGTGQPKLLARNVHPPVLDGCKACHLDDASKLVQNGEPALCLACHDDVAKSVAAAKVPHAAIEAAGCTACHNPHASPQDKLVKLPAGGECLACHDAQRAGEGEVQHGVVALVGCRSCHEPHGGGNPKLLRATGNALCLGCHDAQKVKLEEGKPDVRLADRFDVPVSQARRLKVLLLSGDGQRGHPTPDHRVAGPAKLGHATHIQSTWKEDLSCLACHDPHKGRSRQLLRWSLADPVEACLKCHPK